MTSNRHVINWMHPTINMMILEPIMPSLMNRTGYMMTAEPIIVFAKLITVLAEVSVPVSFELLSTSTRAFFYYYEMKRVFWIAFIYASILASSSAKFIVVQFSYIINKI